MEKHPKVKKPGPILRRNLARIVKKHMYHINSPCVGKAKAPKGPCLELKVTRLVVSG